MHLQRPAKVGRKEVDGGERRVSKKPAVTRLMISKSGHCPLDDDLKVYI